jgi:hypothetical protein
MPGPAATVGSAFGPWGSAIGGVIDIIAGGSSSAQSAASSDASGWRVDTKSNALNPYIVGGMVAAAMVAAKLIVRA